MQQTYREVVFAICVPITERSDSGNRGYRFSIPSQSGLLLPQNILWRCGPIMTVTDKTHLLTLNNSHYQLEVWLSVINHNKGEMDVEKSLENGFSSVYAKYVQGGFPDNWRYILRSRILVSVYVSYHFRVDHRRKRLSTTRRWNAFAVGSGGKRIRSFRRAIARGRCQ